MGLFDGITEWLAAHQAPERGRSAAHFNVSYEFPDLQTQISRVRGARGPWHAPSIQDALGVPAILRCVTLISNVTGQLSVQGFRDGAPMSDPPRLLARPDPYRTPRDFYQPSAYNMATRGEVVWWIASRDGDGLASALVVVPLRELKVEANERNRLRPIYRWGSIESTRWSPATPDGQFVHVTYLQEPGELRGSGPLQLAQAAVSVSYEAQEWAANFYAEGGYGSINLHSEEELEDGEADEARNQWTSTPNNTPKVTSGPWELREVKVNEQGAQMLNARSHQDGEAARMFGVPGALVEFNASGSSLTYQSIPEVFVNFVRSCLAPNYLEPMEQALSDLLPRSTVGRFNVQALYRADARTRWEIYEKAVAILGADEAAQWAREQEGFAAGDIEYKPVLYSPPQAIPASIPEARSAVVAPPPPPTELRCDGMARKRRAGIMQLERCNALLAPAGGTFVGRCRRCKKEYASAA